MEALGTIKRVLVQNYGYEYGHAIPLTMFTNNNISNSDRLDFDQSHNLILK
jgi:hypothetical protein